VKKMFKEAERFREFSMKTYYYIMHILIYISFFLLFTCVCVFFLLLDFK